VERETVDGCLRQIEFLDQEIAELERVIALDALARQDVKRLISVPGVNVITATTFLAAIGDAGRFPSSASVLAAATRSRSSLPPASSPVFSGACSRVKRTTRSRSPH
jgi:transposase